MKHQLVLLLLLAAANTACNKATAYEKPLTPVRVTGAQKFQPSGSAGEGTRYSATIRPAAPLDLAFKTGGYLRELLQVRGADGRQRSVQEGDWVAKGTVLARLREDEFANKIHPHLNKFYDQGCCSIPGSLCTAPPISKTQNHRIDIHNAFAVLPLRPQDRNI